MLLVPAAAGRVMVMAMVLVAVLVAIIVLVLPIIVIVLLLWGREAHHVVEAAVGQRGAELHKALRDLGKEHHMGVSWQGGRALKPNQN